MPTSGTAEAFEAVAFGAVGKFAGVGSMVFKYVWTTFALLACSQAFAEAKVIRQAKCKVTIEGVSASLKAGDEKEITDAKGKKHPVKITKAKGGRASGDLTPNAKKICPNVKDGILDDEGGDAVSGAGHPGPFGFYVGGGAMMLTGTAEKGNFKDQPPGFVGFSAAPMLRYTLSIGTALFIPFDLGMDYSGITASTTEAQKYNAGSLGTITFNSIKGALTIMSARVGSGVGMRFGGFTTALKLAYDYPVSGGIVLTGSATPSIPQAEPKGAVDISRGYKLGAGLSVDYLLLKRFRVGLFGDYVLGGYTLVKGKSGASASFLQTALEGTWKIGGFGGGLALGMDF